MMRLLAPDPELVYRTWASSQVEALLGQAAANQVWEDEHLEVVHLISPGKTPVQVQLRCKKALAKGYLKLYPAGGNPPILHCTEQKEKMKTAFTKLQGLH